MRSENIRNLSKVVLDIFSMLPSKIKSLVKQGPHHHISIWTIADEGSAGFQAYHPTQHCLSFNTFTIGAITGCPALLQAIALEPVALCVQINERLSCPV